MYGGIDVFLDELFAYQYGILVVIALPGHKADEHIPAQRNLAVGGGGAVGQHIALLHFLALYHNGPLVDAGALVGTQHLYQLIFMLHAFRIGHNDAISIDIAYMAVFLGNHYYAAVVGRLVLHTGADIGGLGLDERDGLTLHVGAHQGTVGIVVL